MILQHRINVYNALTGFGNPLNKGVGFAARNTYRLSKVIKIYTVKVEEIVASESPDGSHLQFLIVFCYGNLGPDARVSLQIRTAHRRHPAAFSVVGGSIGKTQLRIRRKA